MSANLADQGGRRLGIDRRQFSYAGYIPERRSGFDRRSGIDRRAQPLAFQEAEERRLSLLPS